MASADALEQQAPITIQGYFTKVASFLDLYYGKDFSLNNPEIVAKYVECCVKDFDSAIRYKVEKDKFVGAFD